MTEQEKVGIKPGVNILGIFAKLNYKPWYAMAEFVDNSVSSFLFWEGEGRPEKLTVEIDLDSAGTGKLEIRDNAQGIALVDFDRAFKTAEIPADRTKLNEFGMGMKTAAIWFAKKWTVRTSAFGDPRQRTVSIDIRDILENQLEELDIVSAPASANSHFTTIRLTDLNNIPRTKSVQKIRDHLTSIYREFVRSGQLELVFNGEVLIYEEPETLESLRANSDDPTVYFWRKKIDIHLPDQKRVTGWVALRKVGSISYAGLSLFRRDRLIMGSGDETYRPEEIFGKSNSYRYQRIFGELHFEGFEVTHTKDSIQWDGLEEFFIDSLKEQMSEDPMNLLSQADNLRKDGTKARPEDIETALANVQHGFEQNLPAVIEALVSSEKPEASPVPDSITSPVASAKGLAVRIDTGANGDWVVNLRVHDNESKHDWFTLGAQIDQADEFGIPITSLDVEMNLAHPFSAQYIGPSGENTELLVAFASNLAVALALGKTMGAKSAYIVDFLNEVMRPRRIT